MPDNLSDNEKDPQIARRPVGLLRGQIWMAEDFDETPDDLIAQMESGEKLSQ